MEHLVWRFSSRLNSGEALNPNPMKRSHAVELQVFLLPFNLLSFFFKYMNREPHLAFSLSRASESTLWRRERGLLEIQRTSCWITSRELGPRSPPSGLNLQAHSSQLVRPGCRGSLNSLSAANKQAGEKATFLPHHSPPFLYQHLHFQSVLSSNGTVYTVTSDTPFHLPYQAVSLRVIAVNIVYTL